MPGENADYGSSGKANHSVMAIVLGSITMVGGAIATPFIPPLGITLLVMGGAVTAGGAGYKIGDKIIKNKKKKERNRENMVNLHRRFRNDPIEQSTDQPVINNDFNKNKVPVKVFDKSSAPIREEKNLLLSSNKSAGKKL